MQIILEANGLCETIEPLETTQSDNKKDKTAITFLYQALPEEQLLQITKHKTAKAIWDALKTRHIGKQRVQQARLQTLKSDFEMLHMKEDETIDTFTRKLTTLVNKAASLGHTIEDQTLVRKLLNVVPDRDDRCNFCQTTRTIGVTMDDSEWNILPFLLHDSSWLMKLPGASSTVAISNVAKPDENISWDIPWGKGRPGWHIECSAMSETYLTEKFDIHGGGMDLMFPHHENEIAESCAANPNSNISYWMNNGFVTVNSEKMSKSSDNFFTIRKVTDIYHPLALRLLQIE
nr:cysteine--tRNA ligase 2, cytoplasmic [Tanacetum cinerariifolium]